MLTWTEICTLFWAIFGNVVSLLSGVLGLVATLAGLYWRQTPQGGILKVVGVLAMLIALVLAWRDEHRARVKADDKLQSKARLKISFNGPNTPCVYDQPVRAAVVQLRLFRVKVENTSQYEDAKDVHVRLESVPGAPGMAPPEFQVSNEKGPRPPNDPEGTRYVTIPPKDHKYFDILGQAQPAEGGAVGWIFWRSDQPGRVSTESHTFTLTATGSNIVHPDRQTFTIHFQSGQLILERPLEGGWRMVRGGM